LNIAAASSSRPKRLLAIIDDMLDLASIEAGKMSLRTAPLDARALVDEVAAVMQDMARSQDLRLNAEYPAEMPMIEGDERRLKQALCNLVSNAIKFTPAGGSIKVAAQIDGDMTLLSVSDTGRRHPGRGSGPRVRSLHPRAAGLGAGRRQALGRRPRPVAGQAYLRVAWRRVVDRVDARSRHHGRMRGAHAHGRLDQLSLPTVADTGA